ncbi:hypothetical protein JKF63_04135 [Porcisia hertigi]|uniref:Uncharacterized protein n=1 Tax=Porcisia hertigi TaxID=2761500 RepID=A0A836IS00_9TRYP|nr:hypothetical protein JKF63_04135 [Porcisia hertigi]
MSSHCSILGFASDSRTSVRLTVIQVPMSPRFGAAETLVRATMTTARRWASTTSSPSPASSSVECRLLADKKRLMAERTIARVENVTRVRELLQACTEHERSRVFPKPQPRYRSDVWPLGTQVKSSVPSPSVSARMRKSTAASSPQFRSSSVLQAFHQGVRRNAFAGAQRGLGEGGEKQPESDYCDSQCWYGAPPGTWMDITYFTSPQSRRWNELFRDLYYTRNEPTAPLLRCPVCAAQRLPDGVASPPRVQSVGLCDSRTTKEATSLSCSSPLWMDPAELQRHLSYIHADKLFTPQQLKSYNAQALHELRYSCGLVPVSETAAGAKAGVGVDVASGGWKTQPARIILVADVANVELGFPDELLEMLVSPKLLRIFSDFPVAVCATHELFVPVTSKALHTLYQLASRHPASTLHVFFANTSLESGDMLTSAYLNDLLLASPRRTVPPVVLLTGDQQQQRALTELHGVSVHAMGNAGHVHCVKPLTAAQLVFGLHAALESSQCIL